MPINSQTAVAETRTSKHSYTSNPMERIFFEKGFVGIGTLLSYHGRTDPGATWEVVRIQSQFTSDKIGKFVTKDVKTVRRLQDVVHLANTATGETRRLRFSYLSYSAIWTG